MSVNFIKERIGSSYLDKAVRQQEQLRELTVSEVQEDISVEYLNNFVNANYRSDSHFLNWVKVIFKQENFLSFYKYHRTPGAASALVNEQILPALNRVFYSDDSEFSYVIKGETVSEPKELDLMTFKEKIHRALIFNHNDILIHDLDGINNPFRELVCIKNVVSIQSKDSVIHKIAYSSSITNDDGEIITGYTYIDSERYAFYDQVDNDTPLIESFHDLGICPAIYLTPHAFSDEDPVRDGFLSRSKEKLEEYEFLKTLQRLTEPHNAFPVQTKLKSTQTGSDQSSAENMPMSSGKLPKASGSETQPGTIIEIPITEVKDEEGKVNMDVVDKYVKYHFSPPDILKYIDERISKIKNDLIEQILGDFKQKNEDARNELDVQSGLISMEDRLRIFSMQMSRVVTISDKIMLSLKYGKENIYTKSFYGSDFLLSSEAKLYEMFEKSPNVRERKIILKKISSTRHKHSPKEATRDKILYDLIPFVSDKDFEMSINLIDNITYLYYVRFPYWIGQFESLYGDIVEFYESYNDINKSYTDSEIINLINNLVQNFIKDYVKNSNIESKSNQRESEL